MICLQFRYALTIVIMHAWLSQASNTPNLGSTGSQSPKFPPRLPVAAALQAEPINAKLTNIMVHDISNPLFARSDKNAGELIQSEAEFNSFSGIQQHQSNNVNTLQQQLVSEGQSSYCGVGSNDPKCNPASYQIDVGGFMPISTTPNVVSSTVIFTSPRSMVCQFRLKFGYSQQRMKILVLGAANSDIYLVNNSPICMS